MADLEVVLNILFSNKDYKPLGEQFLQLFRFHPAFRFIPMKPVEQASTPQKQKIVLKSGCSLHPIVIGSGLGGPLSGAIFGWVLNCTTFVYKPGSSGSLLPILHPTVWTQIFLVL